MPSSWSDVWRQGRFGPKKKGLGTKVALLRLARRSMCYSVLVVLFGLDRGIVSLRTFSARAAL